jgi:hypothetical protein
LVSEVLNFPSSFQFFREIVTSYHLRAFSIHFFLEIVAFIIITFFCFCPQGTGISEEVFRQIETVQNRYDSSTAAAFRAVQKSGEMVVRTLDPRQFIRLASETAPKINIDTNVSPSFFKSIICARFFHPVFP